MERNKWEKYYHLPEIEKIREDILKTFNNRIQFIEESHQYFIDGLEYDCVSNVVGIWSSTDEEAMLENCARKAKTYPNYKYYGMSKEEIKALWDKISGDACDFGTRCHAFGESMFYWMTGQNDKILPECKEKFDENGPKPTNKHEEAIVKFWDDLPENFVPVLAETKVVNKKGKPYCGTFDILFYYVDEPESPKNGLLIFDYKTNKDLYNSYNRDQDNFMLPPFNDLYEESLSHYYLQLACYQNPIEQLGYKVIGRRLIWLRQDGEYQKIKVPDMVERMRAALDSLK